MAGSRLKGTAQMDTPLLECPQSEVFFDVQLKKPSVSILLMKNVSDKTVAFKIQTTAPKKYVVRPCSGTVGSGNTQEVQMILQQQSKPPSGEKCKDKFLIQAVTIPETKQVSTELFENPFQKIKLQVKMLFRESLQSSMSDQTKKLGSSKDETSVPQSTLSDEAFSAASYMKEQDAYCSLLPLLTMPVSSAEAAEWMARAEAILRAAEIEKGSDWTRLVSRRIGGDTNMVWFDTLLRKNGNMYPDWEEFQNAFYLRFLGKLPDVVLTLNLRNCKMKEDETLSDFCNRFQSASNSLRRLIDPRKEYAIILDRSEYADLKLALPTHLKEKLDEEEIHTANVSEISVEWV